MKQTAPALEVPVGHRRFLPDWPRGLSVELAAAYVGLSASTFRSVVAPKVPPVRLTERRLAWLREDLDAWLDRRAGRVAPSQSTADDWMRALAEDGTGGPPVR